MVNEIQVGSYNGLLHKLLSMKEGAPAPTLGPEILAALVLETDRPEWGFLKGERLQGAMASSGPVVGQLFKVMIQNPANSRLLVVVHSWDWIIGTASAVLNAGLQPESASAGYVGVLSQLRDTRFGTDDQSGAARVFQRTEAGASLVRFIWTVQAASGPDRGIATNCPIILAPGTQLRWEMDSNNVGGRVAIYWSERVLDPAENR